jgi:hypothetical protein
MKYTKVRSKPISKLQENVKHYLFLNQTLLEAVQAQNRNLGKVSFQMKVIKSPFQT